jgi:hypothetical protein
MAALPRPPETPRLPAYRIQTNPDLPVRDPLFGWRRITNKLFGWPKAGRVALLGPRNTILTHPENLVWVQSFLTSKGHTWELDRVPPRLTAVAQVPGSEELQ